jgi:hypothetical protein
MAGEADTASPHPPARSVKGRCEVVHEIGDVKFHRQADGTVTVFMGDQDQPDVLIVLGPDEWLGAVLKMMAPPAWTHHGMEIIRSMHFGETISLGAGEEAGAPDSAGAQPVSAESDGATGAPAIPAAETGDFEVPEDEGEGI